MESGITDKMNKTQKNDSIIEVKNLVKKFGFKPVLRNIDFELEKGGFLTLFGPNGAGKTTLIRILCSLIRPTSGSVKVAGYDGREREQLCKNIGVISHQTFLYPNLTAYENLKFYGMMYGLTGLPDRIEELLKLVRLSKVAKAQVQTFSRGMQQRLSVARAIIHDPAILFLDEPFTGLDQRSGEDFKAMLETFKSQGKTILMTSHDPESSLKLCTRAMVLKSGRVVFNDYVDPGGMPEEFEKAYYESSGSKADAS